MPVSTGSIGEPRAKRCKLCDESNHRSESGSGFWQLQLDRDLVDTISAIYPEWFQNNMAEGGSPSSTPRESPPKAVIDTSPLHIDQNKESLKVKLMLRRPFDQLVAQGIMPPHKTPAAYHGQRRQLERAKTGDMLKAKIQQRPPRHELERRHILEADPGHVDPSLAERQRMLKKARLADQLNDQLSHRPGPLELIQKNILHTEEPIEQAVKTGKIPYKATSEGQLNRPQHPQSYINPEDDSQSSEGDNIVSPGPSDVLETAAKSAGIVVSLIPATEGTVVVTNATPMLNKDNSEVVFADLCRSVTAPLISQQHQQVSSASSPASLVSSTSTLSPLSSVASPVPSIISQPATPAPPPVVLTPRPTVQTSSSSTKSDAPGKDKNRKKSKSKTAPKARTIKFHEYKGPPSAQKNTNNNNASGESSYDLLLQQQTLLLQFQLQLQHKYPQIILPASQKTENHLNNNNNNSTSNNCNNNSNSNSSSNNNNNNNNNPVPSPAPSTSSDSALPTRISCRLEDMKVSDLKAELKRRSLPVSGSKPQLIERLKPFTSNNELNHNIVDTNIELLNHNSPLNSNSNYQDNGSPQSSNKDESEQMEIGEPPSPLPQKQQQQIQEQFLQKQQEQKTKEDIVREQQRQIEELQRELTLSQLKLQAATRAEPKAQILALHKHLQARQQQQQQQQNIALQMQQLQALQARQAQVNEEQQRIQQQQHVAFQNQKNLPTGGLLLNGADAALVLNLMQGNKTKILNGHNRTNSLPNFLNSIVTPVIASEIIDDKPPPPLYEEATKQINNNNSGNNNNNNNNNNNKKNSVKSQDIDDVLEILIKNGELPPSAANDPSTPGSAGIKTELIFPNSNNNNNNNSNNSNNRGNSQQQQDHPQQMVENSPETSLGLDPTELLDSLDNLDMDFTQFVMELGGGNQTINDNNSEDQMSVPMDTDDWLDSLCGNGIGTNGTITTTAPLASQENDLVGYDPLLGITQDPFDPFNLEEFRSPPSDYTASLSWDKVDYAA